MFCCSSQHLVPCMLVGLAADSAANSRTLIYHCCTAAACSGVTTAGSTFGPPTSTVCSAVPPPLHWQQQHAAGEQHCLQPRLAHVQQAPQQQQHSRQLSLPWCSSAEARGPLGLQVLHGCRGTIWVVAARLMTQAGCAVLQQLLARLHLAQQLAMGM